jgi:hypothetical protein
MAASCGCYLSKLWLAWIAFIINVLMPWHISTFENYPLVNGLYHILLKCWIVVDFPQFQHILPNAKLTFYINMLNRAALYMSNAKV